MDVKAETVIDVGGSQQPVKGRTRSWDVKKYLIADLPNPHKDSPKPDIELDLNERFPAKHFGIADIVFCLEVFEYVYNPAQAFVTLEYLLKPGGIAYVSFPFVYPHHEPLQDDALRYAEGGIRKLANAAHLEVVELIPRRPETKLLAQFYAAERMRPAKGYDHAITGWLATFRRPK